MLDLLLGAGRGVSFNTSNTTCSGGPITIYGRHGRRGRRVGARQLKSSVRHQLAVCLPCSHLKSANKYHLQASRVSVF